ncbi:helix-turn-helix transcriptional regulator [Ilumatobacter sp.]|uniref:helix-turn-helix transcriptional regulator n=1 Tax=Ilumatobacter sp. TaxID=1967498 RepID=UPI003AF6B2A5
MSAIRRGPRGAEDRIRRLLVMLPWLMERGEVSVTEAAQRFDLTEAEVVKDLELVAMCGLPPFVDELIDVFIDEGMIWVGVPRLFTRPLRLNAVEAWELLAAGRAAMELPGADVDGPLGRGLAKLAEALGDDDTSGVRIDLDRPDSATVLAAAVDRGEQVRITYRSAARDEVTDRLILARQVFTDRGEWYVTADDDRSGEVRIFRIDRIESIEPTGATPAPSDEPLPVPGSWFDDGSIPRVTVRLGPQARWVTERYPVDRVEEPDDEGWVTAHLAIVSEPWFTRTLVRLGAQAQVVEPVEWQTTARRATERVLERYRRS